MSVGGSFLEGVRPTAGGWIAARDPRVRIVTALALSLVILILGRWPALSAALLVAAALAASGDTSGLWRRLLALDVFLSVLLVTLPFQVSGEPLVRLGALTASREGLERAATIAVRANAILLVVLALVGTMEPVRFAHALGRLGVPDKLVHLLLLTLRQIHLIESEYRRLRQAMRARAFRARSDRHTWRSLGWLIGMLLVRSTERSRRVLEAMRCRGFQGRLHSLDVGDWQRADTLFAVLFGGLALGLLALERVR